MRNHSLIEVEVHSFVQSGYYMLTYKPMRATISAFCPDSLRFVLAPKMGKKMYGSAGTLYFFCFSHTTEREKKTKSLRTYTKMYGKLVENRD
jgi:hypothetical protein